jgi:hypothetical protein
MTYLSGPTGGISYHFSALRYRHTLWATFTSVVAGWLAEWKPQSKALIVFGPSAGWTIPSEFLSGFEKILAVEPDPVARALFKRRFAGSLTKKRTALSFNGDAGLLPWLAQEADGENRLASFLETHADAAVLFSNVLGQLPLLPGAARHRDGLKAREKFRAALAGREWASYHDLLSSKAPLLSTSPTSVKAGSSIAEIAAKFYLPVELSKQQDVIDHDTLWLSDGKKLETGLWKIRPGQTHVIGFTKRER